jgi:hypothetical protein
MRLPSLLLLLSCAPFAALADPLASCKEQPQRPGERHFECAGFSLSASAEQPAFGQKAIVDSVMNAMGKDHQHRLERAEIPVGGEGRPGLRYRGLGGADVSGVAAVVPAAGSDKVRLIVCEEPKPSLCDAVLTPFAASLKADSPPAYEASGSPKFLGHTLAMREGCESKVDGPQTMIRCGAANVSWVVAGSDDPAGDDWIYQPMKKALASQGKLSEKQVACRVDGAKATCHDLEIVRSGGAAWHATAVMAEVKGQRVWVQCNVSGDRGKELPEPCGEILSLQ